MDRLGMPQVPEQLAAQSAGGVPPLDGGIGIPGSGPPSLPNLAHGSPVPAGQYPESSVSQGETAAPLNDGIPALMLNISTSRPMCACFRRMGQNREPSFDRHNSNGKLRYSWAVDLKAAR